MRQFMKLLENIEASWSPEELRNAARMWQDAIQGENADHFDWYFDPAFPLARLESTPENWAEFMRDEIEMWADEGQPDRYDDMFDSPIGEAIVIHLENGVGMVWDGCHRVGASAMRGLKTIPAIVGVRKQGADQQ